MQAIKNGNDSGVRRLCMNASLTEAVKSDMTHIRTSYLCLHKHLLEVCIHIGLPGYLNYTVLGPGKRVLWSVDTTRWTHSQKMMACYSGRGGLACDHLVKLVLDSDAISLIVMCCCVQD